VVDTSTQPVQHSHPIIMSSRTSPIHDYFRDDGDGKRCNVNACSKYFAGTNSSWIKHLKKTHKAEYREYKRRAADLVGREQQLSQPVRSPSISSTVSAASSYAIPALPRVTSSALLMLRLRKRCLSDSILKPCGRKGSLQVLG
jgi:hypothetical protein